MASNQEIIESENDESFRGEEQNIKKRGIIHRNQTHGANNLRKEHSSASPPAIENRAIQSSFASKRQPPIEATMASDNKMLQTVTAGMYNNSNA